MSDHEALRALLQRYARAVDERDIEALEALFHPEATIVGSAGAQNREEWLATMRAPRSFPQSMHVIADPLIEVAEGDGGAHLDSYAVVFQLSAPDSDAADLTLGIRYLDEARIHLGRWVLTQRTARTLWMR